MQGFATDKLPGCKVVQVALTYAATIHTIRVTGDFFVHPEEGLELLERTLIGRSLQTSDLDLVSYLKQAITKHHLQLVGITPEAIVTLVRRACSGE